jgi:hypothetical protein
MKLLSSIVVVQLFIASILAASCTLVIHKVGGTITADVSDGECYSLPKSTATRTIVIDGVEDQGNLVAYDGAGCGGVDVKHGTSPLVFVHPVMVASVLVNSCT